MMHHHSKKKEIEKNLTIKEEQKRQHKLSVYRDLPEEIQGLVVNSPAEMNPLEYITLLKNILRFEKNIIITENFSKLDYELLVSQPIQAQVEQHSRLNGSSNHRRNSADIFVSIEDNNAVSTHVNGKVNVKTNKIAKKRKRRKSIEKRKRIGKRRRTRRRRRK